MERVAFCGATASTLLARTGNGNALQLSVSAEITVLREV